MILIAPDSFKGTLSSVEVCEIIRDEFLKVDKNLSVKCIPIADGGEGTVDALLFNSGKRITVKVHDPYYNMINALYGILENGTAVIEMAAASGLPLVGENKNPLKTTTYGTGELILDALNKGCRNILLGIGGSATNDGGIGCVAALGGRFNDSNSNQVPLCGAGLEMISDIDLSGIDERIKEAKICVLCDVISPLYGKNGAAYVFAPQKGAGEEDVIKLDIGLRVLAFEAKKATGKDNSQNYGAGAAGGLGFGLMTFLNASLVPGAREILKTTRFETLAKKSELVITGEGCMDEQSLLGKAPSEVAKMSGKTPVIAIVGASKIESAKSAGIQKIYVSNCLNRPFEEVVIHCREDLARAACRAANDFAARKRS